MYQNLPLRLFSVHVTLSNDLFSGMTPYTRRTLQIEGGSVKFSKYEFLNGVVVPQPDAELIRYDPWQVFRANVGKYRTVQQPYLDLLNLHQQLKAAGARHDRPSPMPYRYADEPVVGPRSDSDRMVLDWCTAHGLLGLVPVLCNSIRPGAVIAAGRNERERVVTHVRHFRDGGQWATTTRTQRPASTPPEAVEEYANHLANEGPQRGVTWFNWVSREYEEQKLDSIREYFLPSPFGKWQLGKEETFVPPVPNSNEFWRVYGEPAVDFADWCKRFTIAVEYLSTWDPSCSDEERTSATMQSYWLLTGLSQAAAYTFSFDPQKNKIDQRRISAGLLASYALMFLWDYMEGRRALRCKACDTYFVSDVPRASYCSPRCRNTVQVRRYRQKQELLSAETGVTLYVKTPRTK